MGEEETAAMVAEVVTTTLLDDETRGPALDLALQLVLSVLSWWLCGKGLHARDDGVCRICGLATQAWRGPVTQG